jgi:hypothetical protein
MDHLILNNGSDSAALAEVALKALREARKSKTSMSGSVFVSDGQTDADGIDLGTGTIINGVDGGIQPWVGDTTPPGKPTGITAESHNGAVLVSWDGTLDGGVPADFDHVQFTAVDGSKTVDMGRLKSAGNVTAAGLTAGDTVTITAVAYDDAHLADGTSAPNASDVSDAVTVTVESAVSAEELQAIQSDLSKAKSDIAAAESSMNDLTATVSTVDGKATTSGKAPAADDATGRTDGAMWYVMDANGNLTDTYILKSGAWVKYAWASSSIADKVTQAISDAQSGAQNALNQASKSVQNITTEYAVSDSDATSPDDGWSTNEPKPLANEYVWMRTTSTYGGGRVVVSSPTRTTGNSAIMVNIHSTRGNAFHNSEIDTTMNITILYGSTRITDSSGLHSILGPSAYIQWTALTGADKTPVIISNADPMVSNDGFTLTLSPDNVDNTVTFTANVIVDKE